MDAQLGPPRAKEKRAIVRGAAPGDFRPGALRTGHGFALLALPMNSLLPRTAVLFIATTLAFHSIVRGADGVEMATDLNGTVGKLKSEPRVAAAEIAPASSEGELALKRMQLPAGLTASLWAAEPMLANPVAFNFDERGRIFVAETHRYRTSVLDIRDYMWTLEDELANRTLEENRAAILRHFGPEGVKALSIESERVRLLEDTDHDGKADRSTLFAEGFNSPVDGIASGVLARRGKVYLTSIPSLWLLENETKAGTAAKRTELSRGYGIRFNFTGHDLHGLILGPDGKLYFSVGDRAAHAVARDGSIADTPDTGAVFRCNPDGTKLEIFATGLRNPQSLAFNEYGDLFTGDNDSDQGDEERLVHIVEGGDSGWRIGYQFAPVGRAGVWNIEKLWHPRFKEQAAYYLAPICNIEDGPSGIAYYPGTGLNESYRGGLFITHFKGGSARSGIYQYNVKPSGASYAIADAKPFLSAALPTDVRFGPDGKLYLSDWSEGWPKSKKGRIYAIGDPAHANDALVKETQALIASDFPKKSESELGQLLGHADWRVRLEAQYTLAERGAKSIPTLTQVATKPTSAPAVSPAETAATATTLKTDPALLARLHAIWGLGQVAEKNPSALDGLRPLLRDAEPEVRAQAIKVLGDRRDATQQNAFVAALTDESNRVKFFAAQSLAKLARPESAAALLTALGANHDEDAYLRHALVLALASSKNLAALKGAVTDSSRAIRLGVLLAYRHLGSAEAARFLHDPDPLIVDEAARAINDTPINAALPALAAFIDQPAVTSPMAPSAATPSGEPAVSSFSRDRGATLAAEDTFMLRVINANFRLGTPAHATAIAHYAARSDVPAALRVEALAQLASWAKPPARDRVVGIYRPLTPATRDTVAAAAALQPALAELLGANVSRVVQAAAVSTIETLEIASAGDLLFTVLKDEQQSATTRAQALATLAVFKHPRLAEAVRLAGESQVPALRLAALPITAELSPETAAPVISKLGAEGNVAEKKVAFEALGALHHPDADATLAAQLRQLLAGQVAPEVQLELVEAAAKRDDSAVKKLLGDYNEQLEKSGDSLAPYRVALKGGNTEKGRKLFNEHPVLACIRCHKVGDDGGDAGPNLASVGATYPREYLLESIVKPNAKIAPGFQNVVVTLKTGAVQAGMVTAEDEISLTLKLADNSTTKLAKAELLKRESGPSSMPEIFGQILTKAELRDLVEYLAGLGVNTRSAQAGPTSAALPARVLPPRALRDLPSSP
jgi:quinoprotein glucose dehydrogenase